MEIGSEMPGTGRLATLPAFGSGPLSRAPTWVISAALHLLLILALAAWITPPILKGTAVDDERVVGLVTLPHTVDEPLSSGRETDPPPVDSDSVPENVTETGFLPAEVAASRESSALDEPPVLVDLPDLINDRLGPASPQVVTREAPASPTSNLTPPRARRPDGGSPQGGDRVGEVQFFGQGQQGSRFVYLLDASASMQEHRAIQVAKTELLTSLASMADSQEFQVIFYNEQLFPMASRSVRNALFSATETNRNMAAQHIRAVQPTGATEHKTALLAALRLRPDVLFFLTDAGEPWLDARDLQEIRRRNVGGSRICVIEFGNGPPISSQEVFWTRRLARENNGSYEYQNIRDFRSGR